MIIFFTGPYYDDRIEKLLKPTQAPIEGFAERQLCQLHSPDLGGLIFRTYHPNYLRRSGLEQNAIDAISAEVRKASFNT